MSQQNVEAGLRAMDALNRRDLDAFLSIMDPDVDGVPRTLALEGGRYHGHDGMRTWLEGLFAVFPDFTAQVVKVRDLGERTLTNLHLRGHGAGSATPLDEMVWQVAWWRNGKCLSWETFQSHTEALAAVGLSE
jgi:ketosteroid isomerase-like protein